MHKLVENPKLLLPYISPYLSSTTCSCVQNTAAEAASSVLPWINNAATKPKLIGHRENRLKYDHTLKFSCKDDLVYIPKHSRRTIVKAIINGHTCRLP